MTRNPYTRLSVIRQFQLFEGQTLLLLCRCLEAAGELRVSIYQHTGVSRTACLDAELHLRLLVRPRGKVVVLAQEVVIVCLCLKDTEIHATSKQGNTTNSALESLHSLQRGACSRIRPHAREPDWACTCC